MVGIGDALVFIGAVLAFTVTDDRAQDAVLFASFALIIGGVLMGVR